MIEKLNKMFIDRYYKQFDGFNVNVFKTAKDDNGNFEVPVPTLIGDGFTNIPSNNTEGFLLNNPARASVVNKKMKGVTSIYRVCISYSETEIAANKPEYFNYLFDNIVQKSLDKWIEKFGSVDAVRFGEVFITPKRPGINSQPLMVYSPPGGDDQIEIRFYGSFSSNEEAV